MNMDGRIMGLLNRLGDLFLLNIIYLVSCIPVVTIGAATTALYYTTFKMAENSDRDLDDPVGNDPRIRSGSAPYRGNEPGSGGGGCPCSHCT